MKETPPKRDQIITFLRKRDYQLVRELGQGACGRTVLLLDDQIGERFVCKKYEPYSETQREKLFSSFVQEIKLLHQLHHPNIIRVFNYYLYPDKFAGYILMEFVDGIEIDSYLSQFPESTNEIFLQAITGFAYLQRSGILHRDVRSGNIMVRADGTLKIIDLGFGKQVETSEDFDKSISLNWWCETPSEFAEKRYDFQTEVYFVGKLFDRIIKENGINHFKYTDLLGKMCQRNPQTRAESFSDIENSIRSSQFYEIEFDWTELDAYRKFADALSSHVTKLESGVKYTTDVQRIVTQLGQVYRNFMLESQVPDSAVVLRCFLEGTYYYRKQGLSVVIVRDFLQLLMSSTEEKSRIILANLHAKLDALPRYSRPPATSFETGDDIPF